MSGFSLSRYASRAALVLVVAVSFAALAARSRPLPRMSGAVEPLLYATGLSQPRAMLALGGGALLVAEAAAVPAHAGSGSPASPAQDTPPGARVVRVDAGGSLTPVPSDGMGLPAAALLWPDTAAHGSSQSGALGGGTAWGLATDGRGGVFLTLAQENRLLRVTPSGAQPVTGFKGTGDRNPLPTGVARAPDGSVYVTLLATDALRPSTGKVVRVEEDGRWQPVFEGLNYPVALAFGAGGQLFVLELSRGFDQATQRFAPHSGRLLAVGPSPGRRRTVVREINFPSSMTISPEGDAYFTENALHSAAGTGHILKVPREGLGVTQ